MSLGTPELLIVLLIILLIFGGTQLPKLARSLGRAQKEFKDGLSTDTTAAPDELDEVERERAKKAQGS
jgi:sec-independent protein translocase protein TatA